MDFPIEAALISSMDGLDDLEVLDVWRRKSEPEATDLFRRALNRLGRGAGWHALREFSAPGAARCDIAFLPDTDISPLGIIEAKAAYSADLVLGRWQAGSDDHRAFLRDLEKLRRSRASTGARTWALLWLPHWIWMAPAARRPGYFPYPGLVKDLPSSRPDTSRAEADPSRGFDWATHEAVAEFARLGLEDVRVCHIREAHADAFGGVAIRAIWAEVPQ